MKKTSLMLLLSILLLGVFLTGCATEEEKAKQDAINAIEKDDSLSDSEKELAKTIVENIDTDESDSTKTEKLSTKEYNLGDTITFSGIELTFTTLEKAMHSKFTDFETDVEHYRLTYEMKNTNSERITPCNFEFVLLDNNGHQVSDSFGVMDDGFDGDEVFPNVKITDREWFETNNDISGDITLYGIPFVCDETCQLMRDAMGFDGTGDDEICPNFEIKLNIPQNEILNPESLELLN